MSVVVSDMHGAIRRITVNRPDKLNALSFEVFERLDTALTEAVADSATRAIVFTGSGQKAFVAGMDVSEIAGADTLQAYRTIRLGQGFFQRLAQAPKPTIAMVNGYALGGGFELALSCDFIVASETARFGFPEIRLATFPGWTGTQIANQKMKPCFAREMIFSGKHYLSTECADFGFINRIVSADTLWPRTREFAELFTDKDQVALEFTKRLMQPAASAEGDTAIHLEAALYALNFGMPHARAAFKDLKAGFGKKQR